VLTVTGPASHTATPEQGRNSLYELAHHVLQLYVYESRSYPDL